MASSKSHIVKLCSEFAIIKVPSGRLVYAHKSTFVEACVDVDDLTLLFAVGHAVCLRTTSQVQKPVQGCRTVADEWGMESVGDWGESEDGSRAPSPARERSRAAGFVVDVLSTHAVAYGLHRGFIFCPRVSFERKYHMGHVWNDVACGQWFNLEIEQQPEKQGCFWKATRVTSLDGDPPVQLHQHPKHKTWVVKVRALVGITFGRCGTAWSPCIGRIHISSFHVGSVKCGDDVEVEAFLDPLSSISPTHRHWVSIDYIRTLNSGPQEFMRWCSDIQILDARVSGLKSDLYGFLKVEDTGEGIYFCSEAFPLTDGKPNLTKVAEVGSKWQVIAYPQLGKMNNPWRALAVLPSDTPLCSSKVPKPRLCLPVRSPLPERRRASDSGVFARDSRSVTPENMGHSEKAKDAGCQTEQTVEMRLLRGIYGDGELFRAICKRFPDLVHELVTLKLQK